MKNLLHAGLLTIALAAVAADAQTRYVSDELAITFRTGPSTQNAVTRNLTSGDRVEVLEVQPDGEWARVRLDDGNEGWVLARYLQDDPTAGLRLATATRQLAAESRRAQELEQQIAELEQSLATATQALDRSEAGAERLNDELDDIRSASAGALEMRQQNENLRQRVAELTSQTQVKEMEVDELRRRERQNWFIIGAAVLFGGIVIGLVVPSLRPKRKSSW